MDTHNEGGERNKKCPFCAEEIKEEAIYCRYCKRDLPIVQETLSSSSGEIIQKKKPSVKWKPILLILFGFILIAGIFGGLYYQNQRFTAEVEKKSLDIEMKLLYIDQFVEITTDYIDNFLYIQSITS